jgi:hypothetical protein
MVWPRPKQRPSANSGVKPGLIRLNSNSRHCFGAGGGDRSRIASSVALSASVSPCTPGQCSPSRKAAASADGCGLASIQHYLVANPDAAPQVGSRLDFSAAGEAVSTDLQQRLRETVGQFRKFLQSKGFNNLDDDISVFVYSKDHRIPIANVPSDEPNSFYYENTLYIHKALSDDRSIALREFTHYALLKAVGKAVFRQTAVESALADYY